MRVCVCAHVRCVLARVHVPVEARADVYYLLRLLCALFHETRSLAEHGSYQPVQTGWQLCLRDPPPSISQDWGFRHAPPPQHFTWDLNLASHIFMANTILTEPVPHPFHLPLFPLYLHNQGSPNRSRLQPPALGTASCLNRKNLSQQSESISLSGPGSSTSW